MIPDQQAPASPALTPLVSGIVSDAQTLLRQQLSLFQIEVKNEFGRARDAAIPLGVGVAVSVVALILLCLTLVHAIAWYWPDLPLFAAYGIVGVLVALVGGGFAFVGKTKFDACNPLPDKSVEGLKENLQWTTKM